MPMPEEKEPDKLGELESKLYQRGYNPPQDTRHKITPPHFSDTARNSWENIMNKSQPYTRTKFLKKLFWGSLIFFILVVGVSALVIWRGGNVISSANIDLEVSAPSTIHGGEEAVLNINIHNKNSTALEAADLIVEYPSGTRDPAEPNKQLTRSAKYLGDISAGQTVGETIRAVMYGEANSQKEIKITLEYRLAGSNQIFAKDTTQSITLSASPVDLSAQMPKDINSGQNISIEIKLVSNSSARISGLILQAVYPDGFTLSSANPVPALGNNVWNIGDMPAGSQKVIKISGKLEGQANDIKQFNFITGIPSSSDERRVASVYDSDSESVTIARPYFTTDLTLNGSSLPDYIGESAEVIRGEINWSNNLPSAILDGQLVLKFNGQVLNKASISAPKGFYRSLDNTITWDKQGEASFASIEPGQSGTLNFTFSPVSLLGGALYQNPQITLDITFRGTRVEEGVPGEMIEAHATRVVKLSSSVRLASRAVYFVGDFKNSGPMPPKVDQETTYTVIWSLTNSSNRVSNGQVVATLPPYMRWMGSVSPASANVTYNAQDRQIVWNIGEVTAGAGVNSRPIEVSFQVGLTPSLSQVGDAPTLVGEATFTGVDQFTRAQLQERGGAVTTRISTDPQYKFDYERVVK